MATEQEDRERLRYLELKQRASTSDSEPKSSGFRPYLEAMGNTAAIATSPVEGLRVWRGMKPETQRSLGYGAMTTMAPELAGAEAGSLGAGLLLRTLARAGAGAGASALSDKITGNKVNKTNMGVMAGAEGVSGGLEAGANAIKPYIPQMAEKFAKIKEPVLDIASKYGDKFKKTFPGTTEAIESGAGQVNKYFGKVAETTKSAREGVFGKASAKVTSAESQYANDVSSHEKVVEGMKSAYEKAKQSSISARDKAFITAHEESLAKHAENIKGLSSDLSSKAHNLDKAGSDLRKAAIDRGINVDPIEELKNAKIGPRERGLKHELTVALPSRMPSKLEDLEVRMKQFLQYEKAMKPKDSLIEAVRLKRALQDIKHVQGGLGYAEDQAVNAYLNTLDQSVKRIDPAYSSLEKNWHNAKADYDRFYDKSKKVFDSLREGEDIGIPKDMLPKSSDFKPSEVPEPQMPNAPERPNIQKPTMIKPSAIEGQPYGKSPGQTKDLLYNIMHPGEGRAGVSKEIRQRIGRAPGAEKAMGNIAAKDLNTVFSRGMLYPLGFGVASAIGTPMAMAKTSGKSKSAIGGIGSTFAIAGLVRAALQSPALYREIVTNPELVKAIVTKVPWAEKLLVAGNQE